MQAKSLQSCLTLCHPMDCSPPGSSVHGILQARILEWVAMPSSRRFSRPRDQIRVYLCLLHCRQIFYHWRRLGSPCNVCISLKEVWCCQWFHSVVNQSLTCFTSHQVCIRRSAVYLKGNRGSHCHCPQGRHMMIETMYTGLSLHQELFRHSAHIHS